MVHDFTEHRGGYVHVIDGGVLFDEENLSTGEAAKVFGPHRLRIGALESTELILIEVPLDYRTVGVWAGDRRG